MKLERNLTRRRALRGAILLALTPLTSRLLSNSANAAGKQIVKLSKLPIGSTYTFTTATQGVPAIVFRTKSGVFAYSLICTHSGCTVAYSKSAKALICPCHGAKFDPLMKAKVLGGPAPKPLASIKVTVSNGWVVEA
jgi:thiosulfate dehydrogenase [quinone] large subunit